MKEVWLIRHGESVSNANLPTKHPAQSELTPRGEAEAEKIVRAIPRAPDLIVVSPFVRARQTAAPTMARFPEAPVEAWPIYEFTYLHPSRYDGTTGAQRGPFARDYWERGDPEEKELGEGESFAELLRRLQQLTDRLRQRSEEFIVLFGHGLFFRGLLWQWIVGPQPATPQTMRRYQHFVQGVAMPNGAIVKATFAVDGALSFSGFETGHMG